MAIIHYFAVHIVAISIEYADMPINELNWLIFII